jgi:hypothetical protein
MMRVTIVDLCRTLFPENTTDVYLKSLQGRVGSDRNRGIRGGVSREMRIGDPRING